jgi:hypothetical protein
MDQDSGSKPFKAGAEIPTLSNRDNTKLRRALFTGALQMLAHVSGLDQQKVVVNQV